MEQYAVTGMSCAACQSRVEKAVTGVPGVTACSVSLLTNSMGVEGTASPREIIRAVEKAGYKATPKRSDHAREFDDQDLLEDRETSILKRRLVLSLGFLVLLMYISMGHNMWDFPLPAWLAGNLFGLGILQLLFAAMVMIVNGKFFTGGFRSLFHGSPNMDTLVAMGASVSFLWSVAVLLRMGRMAADGASMMELMPLYHDELYFESAAMIPALITVGKLLEAISKGRTTNALKSLMRLAPKTAVLIRDGKEVGVPIQEVVPGDIFAVRPGGAIPVDGVVLEGSSAVDESALTGESVPVDKETGSIVSAATINRSGYLKCRATRVGEDTTFGQIIRMVSDAAATKAPIARIADKVSGIFVPLVIGIALITIVGWLVAGQTMAFALARGISVLVISCPCALGLATPVAIMVGNGVGAKNGILFKTGEALEIAGKMDVVVLDKTGTVTEGMPNVTEVIPAPGVTEEELVRKAAALEARSEHPLARGIVEYSKKAGYVTGNSARYSSENSESQNHSDASGDFVSQDQAGSSDDPGSGEGIGDFRIFPGNGLSGLLDGRRIVGGNEAFIRTYADLTEQEMNLGKSLAEDGKTPLFFAEDGRLLGIIAVSDGIRGDSAEAVRELGALGAEVVMLTGDNERTAQAIAREAGISHVAAGVLPEGKEAVVRALQESGRVAMVGDGINDAPALTRANLGIAIGAGTDVAIDSADVVLMNSSLSDVSAAIRISRATLRNVHQNLFWAFFYNVICIPLAAGLFPWKLNPMIAAAAMSLSSFTVCMNALRLNLLRPKRTGGQEEKPAREDRTSKGKQRTEQKVEQKIEEILIKLKEERSLKMTKTVKIDGMMCGHCEMTVKKVLEALPFVAEAKVSHDSGTAVLSLSGEMDEEAVKAAVEGKDYTYCGLE